jgi:hypothetical protein
MDSGVTSEEGEWTSAEAAAVQPGQSAELRVADR